MVHFNNYKGKGMSRERIIKFRFVWKHDGTGEIRTKEYTLEDILSGKVEKPDFTIRWDRIEELRFTGFYDSTGIEIYEEDWLSICAGYASVVKFQDGCFVSVYSHPEDGEIMPLYEAIGKETVVIKDSTKLKEKV
jgi:hypothetical protein